VRNWIEIESENVNENVNENEVNLGGAEEQIKGSSLLLL
jgi:hypothetical protein